MFARYFLISRKLYFEDHSMNHRPATRLYMRELLSAGAVIVLAPGQAHHLRNVLRLAVGMPVAAFNPRDGEWLCRLDEVGRNRPALIIERRLRPPAAEGDLWLLFAPVKRLRLDWLVEKATELGVAALLPVWTRHTQVERLNRDRLQAHAVAAAEQSGRLSVPEVKPPRALIDVLGTWVGARPLLVCDETGAGRPIADAAAHLDPAPAAVLTGPEGGFAEDELELLSTSAFVIRVGLGPRVLRADTAALAALAVVQAVTGDWRLSRAR
jgi:16S rRNA (uracil1498-N3)-methyltransferase